jgi:hypothetical protein
VQITRPDCRLAQAVKGRGELGRPVLDAVLSMHHQAIDVLAPVLAVSATAPDGVIEACEDRSPVRWWVATQFHPEWCTHLSWVMGLFTTFVDACRAYSTVPREEIEPLHVEIRDWLRQRDRLASPHRLTTTWQPGEANLPDTGIIPLTRRTSTLLHPVGEASL